MLVANLETARSFLFGKLLCNWFEDAKPKFVEEYLQGLEKHVRIKQKDLVLTGRIDALYGNVIVEFESNLTSRLRKQMRNFLQKELGEIDKIVRETMGK